MSGNLAGPGSKRGSDGPTTVRDFVLQHFPLNLALLKSLSFFLFEIALFFACICESDHNNLPNGVSLIGLYAFGRAF